MTHEQRAAWIRRFLLLLLVGGVIAGVFLYQKPTEKSTAPAVVVIPDDALELVHYHVPGDPSSEQLAATLGKIQKKYGKLVLVTRVDVKLQPELPKAQGVSKFPHVIINTATQKKVFEFQGLWPQPQIEQKVDEILRGLKRMGPDWRPPVPGMQKVGS